MLSAFLAIVTCSPATQRAEQGTTESWLQRLPVSRRTTQRTNERTNIVSVAVEKNSKMKGVLMAYNSRTSCLIVIALPSFSFLFCVIYSLVANFEEVTATHCEVNNLLPSLSAAIGDFAPQKYVWRAGIGLHITPRYVIAWGHWVLHLHALPLEHRYLAHAAFLFRTVEISCLLGASMVSSRDNYPAHGIFCLTFLIASIFNQVLCAFILPSSQTRQGPFHEHSLRVKRRCCYVGLVCTTIGAIAFDRHAIHCEPYMYTAFAAAGYSVVLCNITFHSTAIYDFHGTSCIVTMTEEDRAHLLERALSGKRSQ